MVHSSSSECVKLVGDVDVCVLHHSGSTSPLSFSRHAMNFMSIWEEFR